MLLVAFERDQVGEAVYRGLADQRIFPRRARPCRVGLWGLANSIERPRNLGDELVAQPRASLVVPKRSAAKLGLRLTM